MRSPSGREPGLAQRLAVYVVTSRTTEPVPRDHRDLAAAALAGGASALQLRAPELTDDQLLPLAVDLARLCHSSGALFIVNDRLDVAVAARADGVHLGQGDDPAAARDRLHAGQVLGVSVTGPDDLPAAVAVGADYVGVTVWPTASKPDAVPAGLETVRAVADASPLPVVGIGGITADNAAQVVHAGAVGVAVISAVAHSSDPAGATRTLLRRVHAARSQTETETR